MVSPSVSLTADSSNAIKDSFPAAILFAHCRSPSPKNASGVFFTAQLIRGGLEFYLCHLFVDGGVDPLGLLDVVSREDAEVEHAGAVIAAVGDGDVAVVHQSVMRGIQSVPELTVPDFRPGIP